MTVTMISSQWYSASHALPGGGVAVGYGATRAHAVVDCLKDINIIKSLRNGGDGTDSKVLR